MDLTHSRRCLITVGLLLVLVAVVFSRFGLSADRAGVGAGQRPFRDLVRWQEGGKHWLLVAHREMDQVLVYSAVDGRLRRRLGREDGITCVAHLIRQDDHLLLIHKDGSSDRIRPGQLAGGRSTSSQRGDGAEGFPHAGKTTTAISVRALTLREP